MIRITLLWMFIAWLSITAWSNWYRSLCGLIILMAVIEHPDMPKSLFEIQGLNPWNILLFVIILAWFVQRSSTRLKWDMPKHINILLLLYLTVIVVSFLRMMVDRQGINDFAMLRGVEIPTTIYLVNEHLVNAIKWVIPGLLLFDGCRDGKRFRMGMASLLLLYFLFALQVIKWMPLSAVISGASLEERSAKILLREIGYHRVNLSMMLAGASWAFIAARPIWNTPMKRKLLLLASLLTFFAQALTGGRTGYGTWAVVGFALVWFRWRRYLLFIPLVMAGIFLIVPGAWERLSQGFTPESRDTNKLIEETTITNNSKLDQYTITAGRNIAWPFVIEKIKDSPLVGYGKEAMQRTGIAGHLMTDYGELFPHPHNAYLQLLLDNGIIGALGVIFFYALMLKYSYQLFKDNRSPEFIAAGGCTLALVLALLVASIGSQTFYPREGAFGMWCAIGLMLRVYMQRTRFIAPLGEVNLWRAPQ